MKKYEDKDKHRMLDFKCSDPKCTFTMEEMNGYFENVPEICPVCKVAKVEEYKGVTTNYIDVGRQQNWRKGLTVQQQADCIADQSKNPY